MADLELIEHRITETRTAILVLQSEVIESPGLHGVADRKAAAAIEALAKTVESIADYLRENRPADHIPNASSVETQNR